MSEFQSASKMHIQLFITCSLFFMYSCGSGTDNSGAICSESGQGYDEFYLDGYFARFYDDGVVDVFLDGINGLQSCYSRGNYTFVDDTVSDGIDSASYTISGISNGKCESAGRNNRKWIRNDIGSFGPEGKGVSELGVGECKQSKYPPRTHYLQNFLGRINNTEALDSNTVMHHDSLGQPLMQTGSFTVFQDVIARGDEYYPYSEIEYIDAYLCIYDHTYLEEMFADEYFEVTDWCFLPFSGDPTYSLGDFDNKRGKYGEPIKTIYSGVNFELHLPSEGARSHQYELWFMRIGRSEQLDQTVERLSEDWDAYQYVGRGEFKVSRAEQVWKENLTMEQNIALYGSSAFKTVTSTVGGAEEVVATRSVDPGTVSFGLKN